MYLPVKFLLFDMDGTVLDTEKQFIEAYRNVLARNGKTLTKPIEQQMIGKSRLELHEFLIKEFDLKDKTVDGFAAEGAAEQHRLYEQGNIDLKQGAKEFVEHMSAHNIPMAIVTASPQNHVDEISRYFGNFLKLFDHIITGECTTHPKPDPDVYLISARHLQQDPDPRDFLVFEDSRIGVQAGLAAGMQVIMIPDQEIIENGIHAVHATKVIKSFYDFIPEEFGLPPYNTGENREPYATGYTEFEE